MGVPAAWASQRGIDLPDLQVSRQSLDPGRIGLDHLTCSLLADLTHGDGKVRHDAPTIAVCEF